MASQIWLEEADEHVWHRLARREGPGTWRTVCGWEMSAFRGRIWPQKPNEVGPATEDRCHDCLAGETTPPAESGDADNLASNGRPRS